MAEFEVWRAEPSNDAAFEALQAIWRAGEGLESDPQIDAAIVDAMTIAPIRAASHRRGWTLAGVSAAAVLCVALFVIRFPIPDGDTFQTAVGQLRSIQLADGSVVRLDTDSQIVVRENAHTRDVRLTRGRAFFAVAHDPRRPFLVAASSTQVRAIGTRFVVSHVSSHVAVTLVQGVVTVRQHGILAAAPRVLHAGETLRDPADRDAAPQRSDVGVETAWMGGHIVFHDKPLDQAIAEANRYSTTKLQLADEASLGSVHVDGVFNTGDTAALVGALQTLYGLEVVRQTDGVLRLQRQAPGPRAAQADK